MKFSRKISLPEKWERSQQKQKSLFAIEICFSSRKFLSFIQRRGEGLRRWSEASLLREQHTKLGFMGHDYLFLIFYGHEVNGDKRLLLRRFPDSSLNY